MKTSDIFFITSLVFFALGLVAFTFGLRKQHAARREFGDDCFVFGRSAALGMTGQARCIVVGDHASAPTKDGQLILRFTDGTELVQTLPEGKVLDLRQWREDIMEYGGRVDFRLGARAVVTDIDRSH